MAKDRLRFRGPSELTVDEAGILYDLVEEHKPVKVVEFPTFGGLTTLYIAEALRELGGGIVYSFDYIERNIEPDAQDVLDGSHVGDNVALIKVDDLEDLTAQLKATLPNTDFLFLDSLHADLDKVFKDIWNDLKEGSHVVLHDVECEDSKEMKTPGIFRNIAADLGIDEFRVYTTLDGGGNKNSFGIFTVKKKEVNTREPVSNKIVDKTVEKVEVVEVPKAIPKKVKRTAKKPQK